MNEGDEISIKYVCCSDIEDIATYPLRSVRREKSNIEFTEGWIIIKGTV